MYTKRQRCYLSTIANCHNTSERRVLLKNIPKDIVLTLTEIVKNLFVGNIPIKKTDYANLKRYSRSLEHINTNRVRKYQRPLLLQQGGAFLPILLPLVAGIIGNLL
jgi:hypothetical protein